MPVRTESQLKDPTFFLLWVTVNTGAWALLLRLAGTLLPNLTYSLLSISPDVALFAGFFIVGGAMGLLQWLVLRLRFSIPWYEWLVASAVGFGIGLAALTWATLLDRYITRHSPVEPILEWDSLIGGLLLGLALGCCQSIAWRSQLRNIWSWTLPAWIVASVVGWSLGMFLAQALAFLLSPVVAGGDAWFLHIVIPGGFAAAVTGVVLFRISGWRSEVGDRLAGDPRAG